MRNTRLWQPSPTGVSPDEGDTGWRRTAKSFFMNWLPPYPPAFSLASLLQWPLAEFAANVAEGPLGVAGAMCALRDQQPRARACWRRLESSDEGMAAFGKLARNFAAGGHCVMLRRVGAHHGRRSEITQDQQFV